jgi:hypothetical protein
LVRKWRSRGRVHVMASNVKSSESFPPILAGDRRWVRQPFPESRR